MRRTKGGESPTRTSGKRRGSLAEPRLRDLDGSWMLDAEPWL